MLIYCHAILVVVAFVVHNERISYDGFKQSINFLGMIFYISTILSVSSSNFYFTQIEQQDLLVQTATLITWFRIELITSVGIIVSNAVFLALRSCFKHKIQLDQHIDERKKLPQVDTILALHEIATAFHTQFVPWIVSNMLIFLISSGQFPVAGIDQEVYTVLFCNYVSVIMIFMLLFISWKKGPEWWTSRSPKIYYGMVLTMFVILPSINVIWSFYTICDPRLPLRDSPNENWIVLYTVICVARIIEYFTTIRKVHLHDARIFIETRRKMQETNIEQLEELINDGELEKPGMTVS